MRWLMNALRRLTRRFTPPTVDREALRDEMTRSDPDFERVRRIQHDAMQAITAKRLQDGISIRRERQFWEQHGEHHP